VGSHQQPRLPLQPLGQRPVASVCGSDVGMVFFVGVFAARGFVKRDWVAAIACTRGGVATRGHG
jgi:hypothetical protein